MRTRGESRSIVESPPPNHELGADEILLSDYIEEVQELMKRSRGCELPGTFNPLVVGELFIEQCQPWRGIVMRAKDNITKAVLSTARAVLDYVAVEETAESIMQVISGDIERLRSDFEERVRKLLEPHYSVHAITYNHYLTENVEKIQAARRLRQYEKTFQEFFGNDLNELSYQVTPRKLLALLGEHTETDMGVFASYLAHDYMRAYYKVSRRKFKPFSV